MHPNPIFRRATAQQNLDFARTRGFGTIAVNGDSGPLLAHVPFWISPDSTYAEFHLVRSNPVIRSVKDRQQAVLSVQGPDGYISPDWYEMEHQVPTWNYVAVHLRGTLEPLPPTELRGQLDRLSSQNEEQLLPKTPWLTDKMPDEALEKMMRAIVPCRLTIETVDGTWKLGQNKPDAARLSASGALGKDGFGQEIARLSHLMTEVSKTG